MYLIEATLNHESESRLYSEAGFYIRGYLGYRQSFTPFQEGRNFANTDNRQLRENDWRSRSYQGRSELRQCKQRTIKIECEATLNLESESRLYSEAGFYIRGYLGYRQSFTPFQEGRNFANTDNRQLRENDWRSRSYQGRSELRQCKQRTIKIECVVSG